MSHLSAQKRPISVSQQEVILNLVAILGLASPNQTTWRLQFAQMVRFCDNLLLWCRMDLKERKWLFLGHA